MNIGRIIATAAVGLLLMFFVAFDLVLFGIVALNSVVVTVLPVLGLLVGGALGAAVGRRRSTSH